MTVSVLWLCLTVSWAALPCVVVVFAAYTNLLFKALFLFFNHISKEESGKCFTLIVSFLCLFLTARFRGLVYLLCKSNFIRSFLLSGPHI